MITALSTMIRHFCMMRLHIKIKDNRNVYYDNHNQHNDNHNMNDDNRNVNDDTHYLYDDNHDAYDDVGEISANSEINGPNRHEIDMMITMI